MYDPIHSIHHFLVCLLDLKFMFMHSQIPTNGKTLQFLGEYPWCGNPMATEAECEHHCDQGKILKNQHGSFINFDCALNTALEIWQIHLRWVQTSAINWKLWFLKPRSQWNCGQIISHIWLHNCITKFSRSMTPLRPPSTLISQLKCPQNRSLSSVKILDTTYHVSPCMNWITP